MTCHLRLHEVVGRGVLAVHPTPGAVTDWEEVGRRWRGADGVDGRAAALDAMPVTLIDMDDLPTADIDGCAGLVLAGRSDQELLAGVTDRLVGLLGRGGVVAFSGQLTHAWLPGVTPFRRTPRPRAVEPPLLAAHPVFAGVEPDDLGGSFIYRDGWHRPPDGAEIIAWRGDCTPGAYVTRAEGGGAVLVHGGANLLAYGTHDSTAARIVPQLIEWVATEGAR